MLFFVFLLILKVFIIKVLFLNTDRTQLTAHPLANKIYNFTHQISLCYLETPQCHLSKKIQGLLMSLKHKTFLSHYVNALELLRIYLSKE